MLLVSIRTPGWFIFKVSQHVLSISFNKIGVNPAFINPVLKPPHPEQTSINFIV
jgi:hypothetical protein